MNCENPLADLMSDPNPSGSSSLRRALLIGLAIAVPVVPIVIALIAFHGATHTVTVTQPSPTSAASANGSGGSGGATSGSGGTSAPVSRIPKGTGALIAYVGHGATVYHRPQGKAFTRLSATTSFNSPTWVLVDHVKGDWLRIVNEVVGNGGVGWIREDRATVLKRVAWRIQVHLARHMLVVYHNGTAVQHYLIADGTPEAPTPTGHFAITDRLTTGDPGGPYGCCILGTSAQAPHHISDWDGGNRIAIHSTPTYTYSSIGQSISHGCMHVTLAEGHWLLSHIPLGTPVNISSA
jgi:lipoprotein-anchoring transpeptidase ErfK/SrfK